MRSFQRVFSSFTVLLSCATMANQFEDLEKTYARLNYALQVENNRRELPYRLNEFAGEVENLYAEGMDLSDLLEFVRSKFRNRKVIDEFEDLIDSIEPSNMTREERTQLFINFLNSQDLVGSSHASEEKKPEFLSFCGWESFLQPPLSSLGV